VTLHVQDVEVALAFYRQLPGAILEYHRPGEFALLRFGQGLLGLLRRGSGHFHLEMQVEDLDAAFQHLRQAGIEPESAPTDRPWGRRDFLVVDPDGNILEFDTARQGKPGSRSEADGHHEARLNSPRA
jgi:catechol 2,3-dioxygenase-like lactoylglutathione lyase family enzyme